MFRQTLSLLLGCTDFPHFVCNGGIMQFETVRQDRQRMDLTKNIERYILELKMHLSIDFMVPFLFLFVLLVLLVFAFCFTAIILLTLWTTCRNNCMCSKKTTTIMNMILLSF